MSKKKPRISVDHSECECVMKQRGPHWGLYCVPHNKLFKWLNAEERAIIRQMDIGMLYQSDLTPQSQSPTITT